MALQILPWSEYWVCLRGPPKELNEFINYCALIGHELTIQKARRGKEETITTFKFSSVFLRTKVHPSHKYGPNLDLPIYEQYERIMNGDNKKI